MIKYNSLNDDDDDDDASNDDNTNKKGHVHILFGRFQWIFSPNSEVPMAMRLHTEYSHVVFYHIPLDIDRYLCVYYIVCCAP